MTREKGNIGLKNPKGDENKYTIYQEKAQALGTSFKALKVGCIKLMEGKVSLQVHSIRCNGAVLSGKMNHRLIIQYVNYLSHWVNFSNDPPPAFSQSYNEKTLGQERDKWCHIP